MDEKNLLTLVRQILAQPTAPFHEYYVRAALVELLQDQADISLSTDAFGNLIASYSGNDQPPQWCFGAHMDHPGWVRSLPSNSSILPIDPLRQRDGFTFLGGVPDPYFESHAPIQEFGDFAMWELHDFKRENGLISSRACDDLIGCAAIVATLLDLQQNQVPTSCVAVFTRAEEVGFAGAISFAKDSTRSQADFTFVSIETSVATADTRIAGGPICRVGDRMSIFDSNATATLLEIAEANQIPIQRGLLDRGSCEATALQAYGIRTAGISVPLGNYHNCGPRQQIKPEFIHFADLKNLVSLLIAVATESPNGPRDTSIPQRENLEARSARYQDYFDATKERFEPLPPTPIA